MITNHIAELKSENKKQVQTFIEDILQRTMLPGISVSIDVNGQTLQVAAGISDAKLMLPMTTDMHFELNCLNKLLTAIVVLELVNEERINLEQAISYYLPELEGRNGNKIKVKHLLSHSAGYQGENLADPDITQDYSYVEFCQSFNQRPMLFKPGTLFDFSHSSSVILGKIVESLTQKKTYELIKETIFEPLTISVVNPNNASFSDCVRDHNLLINPAKILFPLPTQWCDFWLNSLGGPWISIHDLVKIGKMLLNEGSIISESTRAFLFHPEVKLPGLYVGAMSEQAFFQFGLGCAHFPNGSYGARTNSAGQSCALRFDIDTGIVIGVGINANSSYIRDFIIDKLFNSLLPEDASIIPELYPTPKCELSIEEIIGTYQGSKGYSFIVSLEDKVIVLKSGHNPSSDNNFQKISLSIIQEDKNHVQFSCLEQPVGITFFREPSSRRIYLMHGENLYLHSSV